MIILNYNKCTCDNPSALTIEFLELFGSKSSDHSIMNIFMIGKSSLTDCDCKRCFVLLITIFNTIELHNELYLVLKGSSLKCRS